MVVTAFTLICHGKPEAEGRETAYIAELLHEDIRNVRRWKKANKIPAAKVEKAKEIAKLSHVPLEKLL